MTDTSNTPPYDLGFLDRIVAISWGKSGGSGYLEIDVNANSGVNGSAPGSPTIGFSGLNSSKSGPRLLYRVDKFSPNATTAKTITTKVFFLWDPMAPFPDTTTFGDRIGLFDGFGPVSYGQQFDSLYKETAATILQGFFDPVTHTQKFLTPLPPLNLSSAAAASVCANAYNNYLNGLGLGDGPYFHQYWLDQQPLKASNSVSGRGLLQVNELDFVTNLPASFGGQFEGHYLIKIPKNATINVLLSVPGAAVSAFVAASLFKTQTPDPPTIGDLRGQPVATGFNAINRSPGVLQIVADMGAPAVTVLPPLGP